MPPPEEPKPAAAEAAQAQARERARKMLAKAAAQSQPAAGQSPLTPTTVSGGWARRKFACDDCGRLMTRTGAERHGAVSPKCQPHALREVMVARSRSRSSRPDTLGRWEGWS